MEDPQFWIQLFGNLGVIAVLIWYMWYNVTVTQPGIQKDLMGRMETISTRHDETIKDVCKNFTDSLREERIACRQEMIELRQMFMREKDNPNVR